LALTHHLPKSRVDEVIEFCGLGDAVDRKFGGYSLGMGQRLGIAAAMLGDPEILILDEPVNGLDPEGVLWVRNFVKSFAAEGRTVFISSHLMSEMAQIADRLVIIGKGRLIADKPLDQLIREESGTITRVRSPQAAAMAAELRSRNYTVTKVGDDTLEVADVNQEQIGLLAAQRGWLIYGNESVQKSLEDAYFDLTDDAVEYRSAAVAA
jgi:ABC-2 type transport system ATP-binding protein